MNTRRIRSPIEIWEAGGRFAHRLTEIMKLRGRRIGDTLVLLATISVYLIVSPLRFALFVVEPLLPGATSRSVWASLQRRLNSVESNAIFNCVVVNSYGLLKLRRGTPDLWFAVDEFEKPVKEAFAVKEGEVVVDVGAYIGDYAIRASRLAGSTGKVIAVEAEPSNFDALLFNLRLNQADNVTPLNLAAWEREAWLDLYLHDEATGHTLLSPCGAQSQAIKVRARPLDKALEELEILKVDWVKIDVEGAEVQVLRGLEKTISRSPNLKLVVEVHSNETEERCLSILKDAGYEVRWISNLYLFASPVATTKAYPD